MEYLLHTLELEGSILSQLSVYLFIYLFFYSLLLSFFVVSEHNRKAHLLASSKTIIIIFKGRAFNVHDERKQFLSPLHCRLPGPPNSYIDWDSPRQQPLTLLNRLIERLINKKFSERHLTTGGDI